MEFEERHQKNERNERENMNESRNAKPKEASKNLPMAVLLVLVGIICALLYIGWKYMADDSSSSEELTSIVADSVSKVQLPKIKEDNSASATATELTTATTTAHAETLPPISVAKVGDKKNEATAQKIVEEPKIEATPAPEKTVIPTGGEVMSHTIDTGETFLGIANRFNVKAETLKKMNADIDPNTGIKVGTTKLKIRIKAIHTVGPGDILKVVGVKYNVPVSLIMAANKKKVNRAERGEKLIIPFATKQ